MNQLTGIRHLVVEADASNVSEVEDLVHITVSTTDEEWSLSRCVSVHYTLVGADILDMQRAKQGLLENIQARFAADRHTLTL